MAAEHRFDTALRRALDVLVSVAVLLALSPILMLIALLVKVTSRGPVFFVQERVGRGGAPFGLLKFRTMVAGAQARGPALTVGADPRITSVGTVLRRCKLDELPQFLNVLRGDMSLVGPRPEVPRYVAGYTAAERKILAVRPGVTDPASLAYSDESSLLATFADPERAYREEILPRKLALSLDYLGRRTVASDVKVLARTVLRVLTPARSAPTRDGNEGAPQTDQAQAVPPDPDGDTLRNDVLSGVKWSAGSYYASTVLRLAISIGLARLLSPAEFGVMALATALTGFLTMVQESGLSAALVQHRGNVDVAATTALCMMSVAGVFLGAGTWLAAPWAAAFLDHPELTAILRALALLFVVRGMTHAPRAILQRAMLFKPLGILQLGSTGVYGVTGVGLAAAGAGVWSLVWAYLASEVSASLAAWFWCPWRPRAQHFDRKIGRELGRFGRHILGANLLDLLRGQMPVVIIGKLLGADLLGYYWMSHRWASLPTEGITWVVARVAYPVFARVRDEGERFASSYLRSLQLILLLATPTAVGLSLVARPLILTLYDSRWLGTVTALQILAFYGLFLALAASTGEVFKAAGVPRYVFIYSALYTALLGALLFGLGASGGLNGIAAATVVAPLGIAILALISVTRLLRLSFAPVARAFALPCGGTACMTLAVLGAARVLTSTAPWIQLVAEVSVGLGVYAAVVFWTEPTWAVELAALVRREKTNQAVAAASKVTP